MFTKKQITSAIKITVLSAILIVGLNYANAAWSGPTGTAPDGNTPAPINIGVINQIKNGGLGVNALSVFGNTSFTGKATAGQFCLDGCCKTSWSDNSCGALAPTPAPVVTLTSNPTSISYNGQSTLTWSSTNATSCTASGAWSGTKATSNSSGESTGSLTSSKTYTLSCTGAGGSASGSATVDVGAQPITYTYRWSATPWSSCMAPGGGTCGSGTGTQTREIYCVETGSDGSRNTVDNSFCSGTEPVISKSCTLPACLCPQNIYYRDGDGDSFGAGAVVGSACNIPTGYTTNNTDCNDNDATIWRSVNGYLDRDQDGYGAGQLKTCVGNPYSYVSNNTDCNDTDVRVNPGATWGIPAGNDGSWDLNCNGVIEKKWTDQPYAIADNYRRLMNTPTYTWNGTSCVAGSPLSGFYATSYTMTDLSSYACGQSIYPPSVVPAQQFVDSSCLNRFYSQGTIYEMPCK